MNVMTPKFGMGASVRRVEDDAFIRGAGRYTDDITREGELHGYVVRSPVPKGSFSIGSLDDALASPGVRLVLTGSDLAHLGALKTAAMQKQPDGSRAPSHDIPILCEGRISYVGDAVAFIVAESRAQAQDAADLIEIDYEAEEPVAGI